MAQAGGFDSRRRVVALEAERAARTEPAGAGCVAPPARALMEAYCSGRRSSSVTPRPTTASFLPSKCAPPPPRAEDSGTSRSLLGLALAMAPSRRPARPAREARVASTPGLYPWALPLASTPGGARGARLFESMSCGA